MTNTSRITTLLTGLLLAATVTVGQASANNIYKEMRIPTDCLRAMLRYEEPLLKTVQTTTFNPCTGFFEDDNLNLRVANNQGELNRLINQINLAGGSRFNFNDAKINAPERLWKDIPAEVRRGYLAFGLMLSKLEEQPGFSVPGGGGWGDPHYTRFTGFHLQLNGNNALLMRNYQNFDLHQLGIHDLYSRPGFQINVRQIPCNAQFGTGYQFDLNCNGAYGFLMRNSQTGQVNKLIFGKTDFGKGPGFENVNPSWNRFWYSPLYQRRMSEMQLIRTYNSEIKRHANLLGMGVKTRPLGVNWGFWKMPWGTIESIIHRPFIERGNASYPEENWNNITVADYYFVGWNRSEGRLWNTWDEIRTWIEGDARNNGRPDADAVDLNEDPNILVFKMAGVPSRGPVANQNVRLGGNTSFRLTSNGGDKGYTYWGVQGGKYNGKIAVPTTCNTGVGQRGGLGFYSAAPWGVLNGNGVRHNVAPEGFVYGASFSTSNDDVYVQGTNFTEAHHTSNCYIWPVTAWNNEDRRTPDTYNHSVAARFIETHTTYTYGDFKDPADSNKWYFKSDLRGKFGGRFANVGQFDYFRGVVNALRRLHVDERAFLLHLNAHVIKPTFIAHLNGRPLPFRKRVEIPGTDVSFFWDELDENGYPIKTREEGRNILLVQAKEVQMVVAQEGNRAGSFGNAFTFKGSPFYNGVAVGGLLGSTIDFTVTGDGVGKRNYATPVVRRLLNRYPNLCRTGNANLVHHVDEVQPHPVWLLNGTPQQWTDNPFSDRDKLKHLPMLPVTFRNFTVPAGGLHDVLMLGDPGSRFDISHPFPTCNGFLPLDYQIQAENMGL